MDSMLAYRLKVIAGNVVIAVGLMLLLDIIAEFDITPVIILLFSAFVGFLLAVFRMSSAYDYIHRLPFLASFLSQLIVFQIFIIAAASAIDVITDLLNVEVYERPGRFEMLDERNFKLYYKSQIYAFMLIFFFEIQSILGRGFLWHFLTGTYNRPRREERVLMFLDLAGSTSHGERLGEKRFYDLLNDCYALLTKPCVQTGAKILKYVGDEAILSWPAKTGFSSNNCVEIYKLYHHAIERRRSYFENKYGVVPRFRAAVHTGFVVAAYLGDEKKQLDYSGDAVNTTARILEACSRYDADLLVSDQVFGRLDLTVAGAQAIKDVVLKGKSEAVVLYKLAGS